MKLEVFNHFFDFNSATPAMADVLSEYIDVFDVNNDKAMFYTNNGHEL